MCNTNDVTGKKQQQGNPSHGQNHTPNTCITQPYRRKKQGGLEIAAHPRSHVPVRKRRRIKARCLVLL
jgi:hypothetical protein